MAIVGFVHYQAVEFRRVHEGGASDTEQGGVSLRGLTLDRYRQQAISYARDRDLCARRRSLQQLRET